VKKILFVCTGNSCRSVMAEGLMKQYLRQKGKMDYHVLSAGVSAMGGSGPSPETVDVMEKEGVDVSGHISQPVTPQLVQHADAIFCMEEFQRDIIVAQVPDVEDKVHLLKTFMNKQKQIDPNIPDPIGRPKEVYESCLMTIKDSINRIGRWLLKETEQPKEEDE
jgi:protein-tyrosine-phosphatase